ncbi:glycosyltransferase family 22 protein [Peniophora sp. CONT]|nr:glycosyltransferase family 22 protein [Peniophora sp. CONT]
MKRTTTVALALRIILALLTRTFFQPDEYFQGLEPAHKIVFGYGFMTWEWLAPQPIRSVVYPALNVPIYWLLKVLRLDDTILLVLAPKILHGALAAGTDVYVRELAGAIVGERYADVAYFISLTSCFHGLALSRSLSNSLETSLTTVALAYFPWDSANFKPWKLRRVLVFAALACMIRVTNAILWVLLVPMILWKTRGHRSLCRGFITDALVIGSGALLTLTALDSAFYGKVTLTPLSFLATNASAVSLFYGNAAWHYYLNQALPILLGPALPFFIAGVWRTMKERNSGAIQAVALIAWSTFVYSCLGHKEWRFLHPVLPVMHVLAATYIVEAYHSCAPAQSRPRLAIRPVHLAFLSISIPLILYGALFHSSAQISVMAYLRTLPATELRSVGFLMPCHSTPGQSHLHRPTSLEVWALGCEPPLGLDAEETEAYRDQTDIFFTGPTQYLGGRFPPAVDPNFPSSPRPTTLPGTTETGLWLHEWPSHLVFFGALLREEGVEAKLRELGYNQLWHEGNGLEEDPRRRGGVRVWVSTASA